MTPRKVHADCAGKSEEHLRTEKDKPSVKAVKDALLNASRIGFDLGNDEPNNAFFCFRKSILINLALKGALDDIIDRNIEKWAQYSSFMVLFARREIISHALYVQS